jgi:hypothetical protein
VGGGLGWENSGRCRSAFSSGQCLKIRAEQKNSEVADPVDFWKI